MICELCGDKYDAQTEYCDCDSKLKKLYAHAVVDVVIPKENFGALISKMFEGKTLFDTAALHSLLKSRERKAFKAAKQKLVARKGTPMEFSVERFQEFNDYEASPEYLSTDAEEIGNDGK